MKYKNKLLAIAITTALPLVAYSAHAEEVITEKAKMSDGTEVTVVKTADADAAAESMKVKYTTYSFDADKDGFIDNDEVIMYVTRNVDKNNDGFIDTTEFESGSMSYFANMIEENKVENVENKMESNQPKSYTYWDKDKDNRLDPSEVETLVANKGLYKKWDLNKDGKIDSLEFSQATFLAYDKDNNGSISITEWADVVM